MAQFENTEKTVSSRKQGNKIYINVLKIGKYYTYVIKYGKKY